MLTCASWELSTKPLGTVYQGLLNKPALTSLTLRCQTTRVPRPTTTIPPLPALTTLVVYDIDPLCYPDDISLVLVSADRLENLKLHWSPRMRESGEESINLMSVFGRCIANKVSLPVKRFEMWNLYTRFLGEGNELILNPLTTQEMTIINSMGSSDPMTVFLDDTWRLQHKLAVQPNLKMIRMDSIDKEGVRMLGQFKGLERLYVVSNKRAKGSPQSFPDSTAATPTTPSVATPSMTTNVLTSAVGTPTISEHQCRGVGGDFLAVIQSNHRGMRHLLLSDLWQLTDAALYKICQTLPNLEQLGFSCGIPPLESLRQIMTLVPKLMAIRVLIRPGSELADKVDATEDMHAFAIATETWRPEYKNLKYLGMGERLVYKLGKVIYPPKGSPAIPKGQENSINARRAGPARQIEQVSRDSVKWIDIWGLDTTEFEVPFR